MAAIQKVAPENRQVQTADVYASNPRVTATDPGFEDNVPITDRDK